MPSTAYPRRLAAILAADVAGFSRLMGDDAEGALRALKAHRGEAIDPAIARHHGRIVKTTGDGVLAEFQSALGALRAGVDVQRELAARNRDAPADRRQDLRIGIALAEVMLDGDDVFGDGVNVAHRVQALAAPGDVLLTGTVFDQVKRSAGMRFVDLGERQLKNIVDAVRLYRVIDEGGATAFRLSLPLAAPAAEAPQRPSIAVLPFANLGGDPGQDYFAEGLALDILTELGRFHSLHVVSRNASFAFAARAADTREIGRALGVRYLLLGQVRRAGSRIRLGAQLVQVETGDQIWAERFDRDASDVFAIEDELVGRIAASIADRVEAHRLAQVKRRVTEKLEAYDHFLRGLDHHRLGGATREDADRAVSEFERALAIDPQFARAQAWHACALASPWYRGDAEWLSRCHRSVARALELDPNDAEAHRIMGSVEHMRGNLEGGAYHHERAVELNPNDAYILAQSARFWALNGDPEKGLAQVEAALRLDPFLPDLLWASHGIVLYALARAEEAVRSLRRVARIDFRSGAYLAAACARSGDIAGAREAAQLLLRIKPDFTAGFLTGVYPYRDGAARDAFIADLEAAGLPR